MPSKDYRAFDILMREHWLTVFAFVCACVNNRSDAEDITQDTFIAAYLALDNYDSERPFSAYLRGIARNKVNAYLRSSYQPTNAQVLSPETISAIADQFDRIIPQRDDPSDVVFPALEDCIGRLSEPQQESIRQKYSLGRTCQAIADSLSEKLETIRKRLTRSRALLRECLQNRLGREGIHG